MPMHNYGPLSLSIIASLSVAVVLLGVRIFVMQRVQSKRQRENRQETERLRSLVSAYRSLAGSFSSAASGDRAQLEEALAEIILFGTLPQVALASSCAEKLINGMPVDYQALADHLRADLRIQLGLEPIPDEIKLPPSGPSRQSRAGKGDSDSTRGGGEGRGGGAGGGMAAGGVGIGMLASEAGDDRSPR